MSFSTNLIVEFLDNLIEFLKSKCVENPRPVIHTVHLKCPHDQGESSECYQKGRLSQWAYSKKILTHHAELLIQYLNVGVTYMYYVSVIQIFVECPPTLW